jgi:peptide/nickel transport system permease protein
MLTMIGKRLMFAIPSLIGVVIVTFLLTRALPGDPAAYFAGPAATKEAVEQIRKKLGLDKPLIEQFFRYTNDLAHGDFGNSLTTGQPVATEIRNRLPASAELTLLGLLVSIVIAIPLGVLAAVRRNSIWDQAAMFFANLGMGIPSFWLALLLILLFGATLHWLPIEGSGDLRHLILPASVLSVESLAVTMRLMRSSMLEQLGQDYVRTLRAKGVRGRRIIWVHVVRNALIPIISLTGLRIGWLIGYAVIVETVFRWPGLGYELVDSVIRRDYPVAQGLSLLLTLAVLLANFLANMAYAVVDPRLRKG